jgi:hypothetical protein
MKDVLVSLDSKDGSIRGDLWDRYLLQHPSLKHAAAARSGFPTVLQLDMFTLNIDVEKHFSLSQQLQHGNDLAVIPRSHLKPDALRQS